MKEKQSFFKIAKRAVVKFFIRNKKRTRPKFDDKQNQFYDGKNFR